VQGAGLEVGRSYAYRENPRGKSEMLKVKLLAKVGRGGKVKIRFETVRIPVLRSTSAPRT